METETLLPPTHPEKERKRERERERERESLLCTCHAFHEPYDEHGQVIDPVVDHIQQVQTHVSA